MGTLTYTQLKTEILANLGNRSQFDEDRLVNILNLAQMRIARYRNWEELESLTEGTFSITASAKDDKFLSIPANTRDIFSFRVIESNGQSRKLKRRTARWFDDRIPEPEYYSRGDPIYYCRWADKLEFYRVPEDADNYIMRIRYWPTVFDKTGSQTSDLDRKDDLLIGLGTNWAFQSLGRLEDAGRWWTIYVNSLKEAQIEDAEKPDEMIAPPFELAGGHTGEYYRDPWVKGVK